MVTFIGHFEGGPAAPVFVLDTPSGIPDSGFGDTGNPLRAPISSGCTANPFNADGASCQGGAVGTPFFLYTAGSADSHALFAQAFAPSDVKTEFPSDVTNSTAVLNGSANPDGASVLTHFDFGPTSTFGSSTDDARLDVASDVIDFSAALSGLTTGSTVHFRTVAKTDFVAVEGKDLSFTVTNQPPVVSIDDLPDTVKVKDLDRGRPLTVQVTVSEPAALTIELLKGDRVLRDLDLDAPQSGSFTADVSLRHVRGKLTLRVTATDLDGATTVVEQQFKAK
jgi:hypothetical protein